MMSVIIERSKRRQFIVTKGAQMLLLAKSESILWDERTQLLTQESKETVQEAINDLLHRHLERLRLALNPFPTNTIILDEPEARRI